MATVADVRERLALAEINDAEISPHLLRATRDFRGKRFEDDDNGYDEIEAISCKAIYYIAPMLWLRIQNRANQYDETLQTFADVEQFQQYWLDRCESIPYTLDVDDTPSAGSFGHIGLGVC